MGKQYKIYISSRSFGIYTEEAIRLLKSIGDVERNTYGRPLTEDELKHVIKDVDALIVGIDNVTDDVLKHANRLKVLANHGVGLDNIDLEAATKRGIPVVYSPHANADSVADFTLGLILALLRRIVDAHLVTKAGGFRSRKFLGVELRDKVIGIIGFGQIGFRVAQRALGFGMKVITYDPYVADEVLAKFDAKRASLEELLKNSDIVTIHVPLTGETRNLIGEKELKLMKKNAVLINTARGGIVDENALYKALKEGWIAGAAVDVYEVEPPGRDFPLFKLDNVIVTPHIAFYTREAVRRMDMMITHDVVNVLQGKRPKNIANPEVLK
ncbi:MAG: phosphoglycerate dehydrogenase [Candidatus Baldrarchaeia archaeon]